MTDYTTNKGYDQYVKRGGVEKTVEVRDPRVWDLRDLRAEIDEGREKREAASRAQGHHQEQPEELEPWAQTSAETRALRQVIDAAAVVDLRSMLSKLTSIPMAERVGMSDIRRQVMANVDIYRRVVDTNLKLRQQQLQWDQRVAVTASGDEDSEREEDRKLLQKQMVRYATRLKELTAEQGDRMLAELMAIRVEREPEVVPVQAQAVAIGSEDVETSALEVKAAWESGGHRVCCGGVRR
jgi:hypothetical protein